MLKGITERQQAVVETIRMRLSHNQSLAYCEGSGFRMSISTYKREKLKLQKMKLERLHFIAQIGYEDQHLERIDNLELVLKEMWKNYHLEKNPFKRVLILEKIVNVQPYLSSYYDATKGVLGKQHNDIKPSQENSSISESGA